MNNPIKEQKTIHRKTKKEKKTIKRIRIQACEHDVLFSKFQRWGFVHSNFLGLGI
jgi:hypothetical protein